jgi:hypothetical protein
MRGVSMLTLTTRFETILEGIVDTRALKSVPILVIGHAAILCPCKEDLENHVEIHRENTEPQDCRLFPVRNPQQRDSLTPIRSPRNTVVPAKRVHNPALTSVWGEMY